MARRLRVEYAGAIYHITVRSNAGMDLFLNDLDRKYLLSRLGEAAEFYGVRVYLYCLMGNHFHLVVETPKGNLGRFMQGVLTGYGVYFNKAHQRHGHVTQGRYGARLVEGDSYLLNLSRYVHLNPVKIGEWREKPSGERIAYLRAYPWSSYAAYIGEGSRNVFVDYKPLLALTSGEKAYRRFVESGVGEEDETFLTELRKSSLSIGSDAFRAWVDGEYQGLVAKSGKPQDISLRRVVPPMGADAILEAVARVAKVEVAVLRERRRDSRWRAVAARMLCVHGGLGRREAGAKLGLSSGAAVSWMLKVVEKLQEAEPAFRRKVEKLDRQLMRRAKQ